MCNSELDPTLEFEWLRTRVLRCCCLSHFSFLHLLSPHSQAFRSHNWIYLFFSSLAWRENALLFNSALYVDIDAVKSVAAGPHMHAICVEYRTRAKVSSSRSGAAVPHLARALCVNRLPVCVCIRWRFSLPLLLLENGKYHGDVVDLQSVRDKISLLKEVLSLPREENLKQPILKKPQAQRNRFIFRFNE